MSYDGVNIAEQQDFSYATTGWNWTSPSNSIYPTWGTKTTTVTTHDLLLGTTNLTTYTYNGNQRSPSPPNIYPSSSNQVPTEQQIQYQDGSGHTLLTVNRTWADRDSLKSEQHIIPTGASSSISSQTVYQRGPGLVITEQDDYDFGAASPTRKTINTYQTFASGHAGELPCKSVVYDSQSNIASETDTLYDGGTVVCGAAGTPSVTAVSGLPTGGHDESNYSATSTTARGNATSVTRTNPSGTAATTTYSYDETGQMVSMTDPCGNATCADMPGVTNHTTTYSYTDSPSGGNAAGNSNAYATQITRPNTGVAHIENYQYNYATGELTQSADENKQPTNYHYNTQPSGCNYADGLNRLTERHDL